MTYEIAEYLHCSYEGSYCVPCVVVEKNVAFVLGVNGTPMEQAFPDFCEKMGKVGVLINYYDPVQETFEYNVWVPNDYIKYHE